MNISGKNYNLPKSNILKNYLKFSGYSTLIKDRYKNIYIKLINPQRKVGSAPDSKAGVVDVIEAMAAISNIENNNSSL